MSALAAALRSWLTRGRHRMSRETRARVQGRQGHRLADTNPHLRLQLHPRT